MYHFGPLRPSAMMAPDNNMSNGTRQPRLNGVVGLHRSNFSSRPTAAETASQKILSLARGGGGNMSVRVGSSQRGDHVLDYTSRSYSSNRASHNRTEELSTLSHKAYRMASGSHIGRKTSGQNNSYVRRPQRQESIPHETDEMSLELDSARNASMSRTRVQCFKTKMCHFYLQQKCSRGSNCVFAHSPDELRLTPDLSKTKICVKWKKGLCFGDSSKCSYAHGVEELRPSADSNESVDYSMDDEAPESAGGLPPPALSLEDRSASPHHPYAGNARLTSGHESFGISSYPASSYPAVPSVAYPISYSQLSNQTHIPSQQVASYHRHGMLSPQQSGDYRHDPVQQYHNIQSTTQHVPVSYAQSASLEQQVHPSSDFRHAPGEGESSPQNSDDRTPISRGSIDIQSASRRSIEESMGDDGTPNVVTPARPHQASQTGSHFELAQLTGDKALRAPSDGSHPRIHAHSYNTKTRRPSLLSTSPSEYANANSPGRDGEELSPRNPSTQQSQNETTSTVNNGGNYYYSNLFPYQQHQGFLSQSNSSRQHSTSYHRQSPSVPMLSMNNDHRNMNDQDPLDSNTSTTPNSAVSKYGPPSVRRFFLPPVSDQTSSSNMRFSIPPADHHGQIPPHTPVASSPLAQPSPSLSGARALSPSMPHGPVMVQVPPQPSSPSSPGCSPTPSHYIFHNGYLVPLVFASSPLQSSSSPHGNHQPANQPTPSFSMMAPSSSSTDKESTQHQPSGEI